MTSLGDNRARYRLIEPAPSKFSLAYQEWAARADAWAAREFEVER